MSEHVDVFLDSAGEWRFTLYGANGERIATSGEGYKNKKHAVTMAATLFPDITVNIFDRDNGKVHINEAEDEPD